MSFEDNDTRYAVSRVMQSWQNAERYLSVASHVRGEVFFPAILEMRYAGRHVTDALAKLTLSPEDQSGIVSDLRRADTLLVNAQRDAIDGLITYLREKLDAIVAMHGLSEVERRIANFQIRYRKLSDLHARLVLSHSNFDDRELAYNDVSGQISDIVNFIDDIELIAMDHRNSGDLEKSDKTLISTSIASIIALIGALVGTVLALIN